MQSKESVVRAQADKEEENETIKELREQLKIAQSQIYENNEGYLKQIKELRDRTDEVKVNTELDERIDHIQSLQKQLNEKDELLQTNEKELHQYIQFKSMYEQLFQDHTQLKKKLQDKMNESIGANQSFTAQEKMFVEQEKMLKKEIDRMQRDFEVLTNDNALLEKKLEAK